jgi:hypothetical protein
MPKSSHNKEAAYVANGIPRLEAEDLERVVNRIIRTLRSGKPARLPGLGTINPGDSWTFRQEEGSLPYDS